MGVGPTDGAIKASSAFLYACHSGDPSTWTCLLRRPAPLAVKFRAFCWWMSCFCCQSSCSWAKFLPKLASGPTDGAMKASSAFLYACHSGEPSTWTCLLRRPAPATKFASQSELPLKFAVQSVLPAKFACQSELPAKFACQLGTCLLRRPAVPATKFACQLGVPATKFACQLVVPATNFFCQSGTCLLRRPAPLAIKFKAFCWWRSCSCAKFLPTPARGPMDGAMWASSAFL